MSRESQRSKIRHLLNKGFSINRYEAEVTMKCARLAARINELKGEGLPISKEMVQYGGI